jgi:hypothetical protein
VAFQSNSVDSTRKLMLNLLRATLAAARRQRSSMLRAIFPTLLVLITVGIATPGYSLGADGLASSSSESFAVKCSFAPVTPPEQCHLDLNDRMKMDLGTWGNGVHPRGPNFFCVQRHKQFEAQNRACR